MKILMINKFLFPHGGSETYIFNIGKQLQSLGHEVQYFGMNMPEGLSGMTYSSIHRKWISIMERYFPRLPIRLRQSIHSRQGRN